MDPLRPWRGAANLGAAALARGAPQEDTPPLYELGEVLAYNSATHTAVLRTHSGRPLKDVPQIKATAGGFDHLPTGTTVVVFYGLSFPAILGCIDLVGQAQSAIPAPTLTGVEGVGDADPTQATQGSNSYKPPGAPTDMTQGDWAQVGTLGNHVAVLEGGVSSFGSPAALIQALATSGTLRAVARRIQQFTDFGQLTIEEDQGKTSLVLRAGSNKATQTGMDEQHWTIRLDLGASGDILDFNITEPEGKLLFRLHAGADGRVQIYGDGGVDISSGPQGTAGMRHDVVGRHTTAVTGDTEHTIGGSRTSTVGGSSSTSIGGNTTTSTNGDSTEFVGGNRDVGVGGDETHVTTGARTTKIGEDEDVSVERNITVVARLVHTLEGFQIKFGKNAVEPLIKGTSFGANVISQLSAAATALATAAATASAIASAPPGPPTTTAPALGALIAGVSSAAAALAAGASAYASTLSTKVKTE
jgi:hypothetical protein